MADELILKIKIETPDAGKKLQSVEQDMQKIKKSAKESGEELGKTGTASTGMWSKFTGGAKAGATSMQVLKGAMLATGIPILIGAIKALVDWFKKTETGSDLIAKVMKGVGQAIKEGPVVAFNVLKLAVEYLLLPIRTAIATFKHMKEVLAGRESLKEAAQGIKDDIKALGQEMADTAGKIAGAGKNIKDALALADQWDKLEDKRRDQKVKLKQLEAELQNLREKAADTDEKLADRIMALNQANSVATQQFQTLKADKLEEIRLIEEELRLYPDNAEWIEKLATAKGELADVDAGYAKDRKMIGKQLNTLQKQEVKDVEDAEKEKQKALDETNKEQAKLQEEQTKKTQEELDKQLKIQKQHEDDVQKLTDEMALQKAQKGQYYDALRLNQEYESRKKAIEESEKSEEQKLEEMNLLWELYLQKNRDLQAQYTDEANAAEIEANKKKLDDQQKQEKDTREAIAGAALEVVTAGINAAFSVKQQRLNDEKEKELSNKNLTEAQKEAINKKYADKQKRMDIAQALINVALGVTKALAGSPPPMNFIMAGVVAALGAIQVAAIAKTKYALGGFIGGKKHANGGTIVEAQQGEFIVNDRTMANPQMAQDIVAMNAAGNTGAQPPARGMSAEEVAQVVANSIKSIPIVVTENQITTAQTNVQVRQGRFSVV